MEARVSVEWRQVLFDFLMRDAVDISARQYFFCLDFMTIGVIQPEITASNSPAMTACLFLVMKPIANAIMATPHPGKKDG